MQISHDAASGMKPCYLLSGLLMRKTYCIVWLTLWLILLSGCQSLPVDYDHAKESAEQRLALAYQSVQKVDESATIEYDMGFFIPPIEVSGVSQVSWGQEWVEFNFSHYPLHQALTDLLLPHGANVRLLDNIDPELPVSLVFRGEVVEALKQLGIVTGVAFEVGPHVVTARQFEMAEFDVAFLAGSTNFFLGEDARVERTSPNPMLMTTSLNDESPQYLNFTSEALSVWTDLEQALGLLLSTEGEVVINQSSTSVLVKDYPQHVAQVRAYLLQQNQRLTRQVAVDVQVIDVSFSDSQQAGIDWDLVYQTASGSSIVNFATGLTESLQGGLSGAQLGLERTTGRFSGSQALINALSQQGVVEVSSHPRVVSLNNQIAKIVLEDNATYLASAGSSATANVGSSDVLIPGVVTTGFELYVLPKVANSQVVMQLSTSLSDLIAIDQVSSGDKTIQTPHTNRKKFFMKALVADGETLLISGMKNSRRQWREQKGFASWLLGGQRQSSLQHSETVLLLTPRILPAAAML